MVVEKGTCFIKLDLEMDKMKGKKKIERKSWSGIKCEVLLAVCGFEKLKEQGISKIDCSLLGGGH